jgi:hypothetical protein
VERTCAASKVLQNYEISVRTLRGATAPILFGRLPDGAAEAEVAADGGDIQARFRKAALVPLEVRDFGESGRFVVQAAPPGPEWDGKNSVPVGVRDGADQPLVPRAPR